MTNRRSSEFFAWKIGKFWRKSGIFRLNLEISVTGFYGPQISNRIDVAGVKHVNGGCRVAVEPDKLS